MAIFYNRILLGLKMKNYRYVRKSKKALEIFSSIKQYNNKYYPNKKSDTVQEQFDNAVYNGDIMKAVKVLTKYHFKKFNSLLRKSKLKLVSHF